LLAHRKKLGLCFKCGEKWSNHHKCPQHIPLHVLEEILDAIEPVSDSSDDEPDQALDSESPVLAIADKTEPHQPTRRTMKLLGTIAKQQVLILVDSGSIGTFISHTLVQKLQLSTESCDESHYKSASGGTMICNSMVKQLPWLVQGHTFLSDAKVLNLQCYDMILGQDWLETYSPMWIHWGKKMMRFTHRNKRISLQGVTDNNSKCPPESATKLQGLLKHGAIAYCIQLVHADHIPVGSETSNVCSIPESVDSSLSQPIQSLIDANADLFVEPTTLPPQREADHHIPLLPGAQPVNVRPYRYSPAQKIEIENQVREMLQHGIIRVSSSPFASPVLLVKKKDGTWRFCVYYRHLNAITVKNKQPLPIVDELLDELAGSVWFTKLDFRSGYHQICIAQGDAHKTAFRTYNGLYEFLVMPFGPTNAPASFQSLMNTIFAPLMRKCVLVFMDDILVYSKTLDQHVQHLSQVFQIIRDNQFLIKKSKYAFAQQSIEYLGHIISSQGVSTEPSKILAVKQWPTPSCLKELRGFLGLTGHYRKFIKNYGMISKPLTLLLKKGTQFIWTPTTEEAFQLLKHNGRTRGG